MLRNAKSYFVLLSVRDLNCHFITLPLQKQYVNARDVNCRQHVPIQARLIRLYGALPVTQTLKRDYFLSTRHSAAHRAE